MHRPVDDNEICLAIGSVTLLRVSVGSTVNLEDLIEVMEARMKKFGRSTRDGRIAEATLLRLQQAIPLAEMARAGGKGATDGTP